MINNFTKQSTSCDAKSLAIDLINEIVLAEYYKNQNSIEADERWNNVEELLNSIEEFYRKF